MKARVRTAGPDPNFQKKTDPNPIPLPTEKKPGYGSTLKKNTGPDPENVFISSSLIKTARKK